MTRLRFSGIYAPLATPFDHRGDIYWSKVEHNLAQLRRTTLSGFLACDRWGEGPLLSGPERAEIWRRVASLAGDDAQVLAAIPGGSVATARAEVAAAAEAGCPCAVVEAPDLSALGGQSGSAELYFRAVADSSPLPLVIAARMGGEAEMSAQRLAALAAHPSIAGALLEGDAAQAKGASEACGAEFSILVRDLDAAVQGLSDGACAAVLAVAAAVPFHALSIEEAVRTREIDAADAMVARAAEFDGLLQEHGVPALKCALDLRSCYGGSPRLPLLGASPETAEAVSRSLRELAS